MEPEGRGALVFKVATEDREFEAIHRLNYRCFVEEIPQHPPTLDRRRVDPFHAENLYVICWVKDSLVGMVAGRCQRPFSLDRKLPELDRYLPPARKIVEVRLLAVEPGYRKGPVFCGLVRCLAYHFRNRGCDLAIISATTCQLRLYQHLGCERFGPLVGTSEAPFQPMYLKLETVLEWPMALRVEEDTL